jgi:hypothetical protein
MSYPRKSATILAANDYCKEADWDAMVDAANGITISGIRNYPCNYIIRNNGGEWEAIDSQHNLVYGGSGDEGTIDGSDSSAVCVAAINACSTAGGGTVVAMGTYTAPVTVTAVTTLADKVTFKGVGYVNWTTDNAGVDALLCGLQSCFENVFVFSNSTYGHIVSYTEQYALWDRYYDAFPTDGGAITGTPMLIQDGDIDQEGAGKLSRTKAIWFWEAVGGVAGPQIIPVDADTLAIKNWADTLYKKLKVGIIIPEYGIVGADDIYFQTADNAAKFIDFKSYTGGAQIDCAKLMNGTFALIKGYLSDYLEGAYASIRNLDYVTLKHDAGTAGTVRFANVAIHEASATAVSVRDVADANYVDFICAYLVAQGAATCTEANKTYFKIKIGATIKRVACFDDA